MKNTNHCLPLQAQGLCLAILKLWRHNYGSAATQDVKQAVTFVGPVTVIPSHIIMAHLLQLTHCNVAHASCNRLIVRRIIVAYSTVHTCMCIK